MTTADTRATTYYDLRENLGKRQQEVLSLVRLHPGHTALELAKLAGWADPNRVRPRLVELAEAGHIEAAGNRECAASGKMAMCWRIPERQEQEELDLD